MKPVVYKPQFLERTVRDLVDNNQRLIGIPIVGGELLSGVSLSTSTSLISHRLGRPWRGWVVVDNTASQTVYRDSSSTADKSKYLPLKASGTTTVTLWVF